VEKQGIAPLHDWTPAANERTECRKGPSEPWPRPSFACIIPTYEGKIEILYGPDDHHPLEQKGSGEQASEPAPDPCGPQDHRLQGIGIREPSLGSTAPKEGWTHERWT
jgi:hypothetical protein